MAIPTFGLTCRSRFPLRPSLFYCLNKTPRIVSVVEALDEPERLLKENSAHDSYERVHVSDQKAPEWKKWSSKDLGISTSKISRPTRVVLNGLRKKGYDVYLVGGCVRDLILKRTPKDFDIITSAELKQVMRTFSQCEIVGKRFPICHVHIDDTIVEVSSFSTSRRKLNSNLSYDFSRTSRHHDKDYILWRNCLQRDFTINGLMFDPYAHMVYDYIGGIEDIRKAKVRTLISASRSFHDDCARILRAVRVAARLGFRFTKETARSVKDLSCTVLRLDKGRLLMELNYMLAFGSAEPSLRLLWKFGLLEVLLPIQAAYFVSCGFRRRDKRTNMLLSLFFSLDKLLAPDRPCHASLWVAILAFHKALLDQPRDPLVVAMFSLAVHNGGNLSEAVKIARNITKPHNASFHELLEPQDMDSEALTDEVTDLAASVKSALSKMTDEYFVSQAMAAYPQAPYSDLVFIPLALYLRVCKIFDCVRENKEKGFVSKEGSKIDYQKLALGALEEVRHVFARVVFDTIYLLKS